MSNRIAQIAAAVLAFAPLAVPALAETPGAVFGAKTVGAMTLETYGIATTAYDVGRQGGFAAAGAAQWIRTPAEPDATGSISWVSAPAR